MCARRADVNSLLVENSYFTRRHRNSERALRDSRSRAPTMAGAVGSRHHQRLVAPNAASNAAACLAVCDAANNRLRPGVSATSLTAHTSDFDKQGDQQVVPLSLSLSLTQFSSILRRI